MKLSFLISFPFLLVSLFFFGGKESKHDDTMLIQTGNDSLSKDISTVINELGPADSLASCFLKAYQDKRIYFVPQRDPDRIVDMMIYKSDPLKYKFRYDIYEYPYLSAGARKAIIIHEMYHIFKGQNTDNDHDHEEMTKDPVYLHALEKLFPDKTLSFYDLMAYAGTMGSPVFEELPLNKQDELIDFFHRNKIYY
ncbi:MAG: hypothetical protein ACRCX4_15765 [Bacteroidales bacterium]